MMLKKILATLLGMAILTGCSNPSSNPKNFSIEVASSDNNMNTYVATTGKSITHIYTISLVNTSSILSFTPTTYNIATNSLALPFSIDVNTCQNVSIGSTCTISVTYAPNTQSDYFNQQSLILTSSTGSIKTLGIKGVPPIITIPLQQFANTRTGVNVAVGGGNSITATFDTGSALLVIEQGQVGPQVRKTDIPITVQYSNTTLTGKLAYAPVMLGDDPHLVTDYSPIVITDNNAILPIFQARALLGMKMDTQISIRDFLPYPYDQMMVTDRVNNLLTVGKLSADDIAHFASVQLHKTSCDDYSIPDPQDNYCWYDRGVPVTYNIQDDPDSPVVLDTIFDSGEPNSTYYTPPPTPGWAHVNGNFLTNNITANLIVGGQTLPIHLADQKILNVDPSNTLRFNAGYMSFNYYKVLSDQADGIIGLMATS